MNGLGEFLGSAFAWWFLSYPENLKGTSAAQCDEIILIALFNLFVRELL